MSCTRNCRQGRDCSCTAERTPTFQPTFDIEGPHSSEGTSMFASRWFWIAAVVSALLWVLADWALSVYWPH